MERKKKRNSRRGRLEDKRRSKMERRILLSPLSFRDPRRETAGEEKSRKRSKKYQKKWVAPRSVVSCSRKVFPSSFSLALAARSAAATCSHCHFGYRTHDLASFAFSSSCFLLLPSSYSCKFSQKACQPSQSLPHEQVKEEKRKKKRITLSLIFFFPWKLSYMSSCLEEIR